MMEEKFRLDRTAFKATTAKETDDHVAKWADKIPRERLEAAWFLINHAYGIDDDTASTVLHFPEEKEIPNPSPFA